MLREAELQPRTDGPDALCLCPALTTARPCLPARGARGERRRTRQSWACSSQVHRDTEPAVPRFPLHEAAAPNAPKHLWISSANIACYAGLFAPLQHRGDLSGCFNTSRANSVWLFKQKKQTLLPPKREVKKDKGRKGIACTL